MFLSRILLFVIAAHHNINICVQLGFVNNLHAITFGVTIVNQIFYFPIEGEGSLEVVAYYTTLKY